MYQGKHLGPSEAAQAGSQCRYGHGANVVLLEGGVQGDQAGADVVEDAGVSPVVLGWQVDDGPRWRVVEDLDLAGPEQPCAADFEVWVSSTTVLWRYFLACCAATASPFLTSSSQSQVSHQARAAIIFRAMGVNSPGAAGVTGFIFPCGKRPLGLPGDFSGRTCGGRRDRKPGAGDAGAFSEKPAG